ncbi:MAG: prolipoprotein diacylglyceryl transferase [Chloroflexi bacterium]|nr:prolipoprotein diacylglyceryl transferase [Chloroflexota bacterium]
MPVGFNIGPLFVRFYGIILMLGAIAAAWLAAYQARRRGQDAEFVWDGLTWVLIGGVIGARLWHIFTPPPSMVAQGITVEYYLTHPLDALAIWRGGLGIPGAVIGGALALFIICRKRKTSFALWADIVAPALALGQAIGRWGNFVNQELYGLPTDLRWGIFIEPTYRVPGYEQFTHFHPTFLYESLWNFANMALLLWLGKKYAERLIAGDLMLIYLIAYPVGRFLLEFLRLDSAQVAGINTNQAIMAGAAVVSALTLLWRHRMIK